MGNQPDITTIITTYKRPLLLKRAIQSAIDQTYSNIQISIYDNASNDETESIVRELQKIDSRIVYHRHSTNLGMLANYKYALEHVTTPYFSLLSDDDILYPNFYADLMKEFQKFPDVAFCGCDLKIVDEDANVLANTSANWNSIGYFRAPYGLKTMVEKNGRFLYPISLLFKTAPVLKIAPGWDNPLRWDTQWLLKIISEHPFVLIRSTGCEFFAHSEGFSNSHCLQMLNSSDAIKTFITSTNLMIKSLMQHLSCAESEKREIEAKLIKVSLAEIAPYIKHLIEINNYQAAMKVFIFSVQIYGLRWDHISQAATILTFACKKYFIRTKRALRNILNGC